MKEGIEACRLHIDLISDMIREVERLEFSLAAMGFHEERKPMRHLKRQLIFRQTSFWHEFDSLFLSEPEEPNLKASPKKKRKKKK